MRRSLGAKALLLAAAGAAVLWLGWDGGPDPVSDPSPAPAARPVAVAPAGVADAGIASAAAPQEIDVNRASVEQLTAVPGIGPVLAERIVSHRRAVGPYTSFEELLDVRGIGPGRLSRLRASLTLSGIPSQPPTPVAREAGSPRGPRS